MHSIDVGVIITVSIPYSPLQKKERKKKPLYTLLYKYQRNPYQCHHLFQLEYIHAMRVNALLGLIIDFLFGQFPAVLGLSLFPA